MKKIPTLFVRDIVTHMVIDEVAPGCEWVTAGEGVATRKLDGTCCMVRDGKLYKRYEVKPGGTPPPNFESANEVDENTGKQQGWLPVGDGLEDKYHREAWEAPSNDVFMYADWTYELVGPKVQGNPEQYDEHTLVAHGSVTFAVEVPSTYNELRAWFEGKDIEGVVWWRDPNDPDCDKVKIKGKDFGIRRNETKK